MTAARCLRVPTTCVLLTNVISQQCIPPKLLVNMRTDLGDLHALSKCTAAEVRSPVRTEDPARAVASLCRRVFSIRQPHPKRCRFTLPVPVSPRFPSLSPPQLRGMPLTGCSEEGTAFQLLPEQVALAMVLARGPPASTLFEMTRKKAATKKKPAEWEDHPFYRPPECAHQRQPAVLASPPCVAIAVRTGVAVARTWPAPR